MTTVGLPDSIVRESRDRVRAAIRNARLEFPMDRITINLAPAGLSTTTAASSKLLERSEPRSGEPVKPS
jgi:predicted ATPase with chaperone activity